MKLLKKPVCQKIAAIACAMICLAAVHSILPAPATNAAPIPAEYTLLEPLPCIPTAASPCASATMRTIDVTTYVNYIFRLAIALAAFLAVFMFTVGGFQYMMSEAMGSKSEAKSRMTNSVLGLLAALASYLILYTIDPRLVQVNANIEPLVVSKVDIFKQLDQQILDAQKEFDDWRAATRNVIASSSEMTSAAKRLRDRAEEIQAEIDGNDLTEEQRNAFILQRQNLIASSTELEGQAQARMEAATIAKGVNDLTRNQVVTDTSWWNMDGVSLKNATTSLEALNALQQKIASSTGREFQSPNLAAPTQKMIDEIFIPEKRYQINVIENYKNTLAVQNAVAKPYAEFDKIKAESIKSIETRAAAKIAATSDPVMRQKYEDDKKRNIAAINAIKNDPYIPGNTSPYGGYR